MKNKYVAYYGVEHEFETFKTFEDAEKWLQEKYNEDGPEGFSEESSFGDDFIAEITHRSTFIETANKKDYKWSEEEQGYFLNGDPNNEEWPHDNDIDSIGKIELRQFNEQQKEKKNGNID